jgi:excisionase family DNA binding protein
VDTLTELLDVRDVARVLNVKVGRVYALAESRDPAVRLPSVRIGRLLRFRAADVERYVDERVAS